MRIKVTVENNKIMGLSVTKITGTSDESLRTVIANELEANMAYDSKYFQPSVDWSQMNLPTNLNGKVNVKWI